MAAELVPYATSTSTEVRKVEGHRPKLRSSVVTVKPLGGPATFTSSTAGEEVLLADGVRVARSLVVAATGVVAFVEVLVDLGVDQVRGAVAIEDVLAGATVAGLNESAPAPEVVLVRAGAGERLGVGGCDPLKISAPDEVKTGVGVG